MLQSQSVEETVGGGPGGRFGAAYRILKEAIAAKAFPGCAFGVWEGDRVQLQGALGQFTYDVDAPLVAPVTVFDVASLTKVAATTATTMLLVQRGQLSVATPLGHILPAFTANRASDDPAHRVTLRHLLAHSSGLTGYVEFFRTAGTPVALLSACYKLKLDAEPGAREEYSDPGFILLGKALEATIGEPIDQWAAREVFQPLGMGKTFFRPAAAMQNTIPPTEEDRSFRKRLIQGEVQDENAWVLGGVAGHAGLFSNVPDLLSFSAAILDSVHNQNGNHFFHRDTVEIFSRRQLPPGSSRALGWDTPSENSSSGRVFSHRSIGHLGFSGCSLWIDLERAVAIVLLTNRTWPDRSSQLIQQVRPAFHDAVRQAL